MTPNFKKHAEMGGEDEKKEGNAVALKLPTFWTSQPQVWFSQAEAQFAIKNITAQTTKYYYVVAALDQQAAGRLVDILAVAPTGECYSELKARLLSTYGLGRQERAAKLLHMNGLGDRKPSELMDQMLSLLGGDHSCLLFEQLYLEQLPEDIRLQVARDDFTNPRDLAAKADILWQAKNSGAQDIARIERREERRETIASRPREERRETIASRPRTPVQTRKGYCTYHMRFGAKAYQCQPPCSYKAAGNADTGSH